MFTKEELIEIRNLIDGSKDKLTDETSRIRNSIGSKIFSKLHGCSQEEPVSKVWHDASERPDYNVGKTVIVGYNDDDDLYDECNNVAYHTTLSILVSRKDLNTRVVRWAYLKDLI